jgi:uncharacterized protein (TIGR03435 family)
MFSAIENHLWQTTLFVIALWLITLGLRHNAARVRFVLWSIASAKFLIPFSLLISIGARVPYSIPAVQTSHPVATIETWGSPFDQAAGQSAERVVADGQRQSVWDDFNLSSVILLIWLTGFVAVAIHRALRIWRAVGLLRQTETETAESQVLRQAALNRERDIRFIVSPKAVEPGIYGVMRPTLVLPAGIVAKLSEKELVSVIEHEIQHIDRWDNLTATIHMVVEATFWFHPLVWWIGSRLLAEREFACDEAVMAKGVEPETYAGAILKVCQFYVVPPAAQASGVTGSSNLKARIVSIMRNRQPRALTSVQKCVLAVFGGFVVIGPLALGGLFASAVGRDRLRNHLAVNPAEKPPTEPVFGQLGKSGSSSSSQAKAPAFILTPLQAPQAAPSQTAQPHPRATPQFEVASIKPCAPGDGANRFAPGERGGGTGGGIKTSPGRLYVNCMSLVQMLNAHLQFGGSPLLHNPIGPPLGDQPQIKGGPSWIRSDRYTIDAETKDPVANSPAAAGPTPVRPLLMGAMFLALLEDRFQLKTHRETEEVPMYSLTVAPGGLKMQPMEEGGCIPHDPSKGLLTSEMFPLGQTPLCVQWNHTVEADWKIDGAGQKMSNLAAALSQIMDRYVLDKTGLAESYTYHLRFAHDDATPGNFPPDLPPPFTQTDLPPGPSVFTALEQLGLKLVKDKGPRENLVIDSVQRPSPN